MKQHIKGAPRVAVTGVGLTTSLGIGLSDNWQKLLAGQSGVRTLTRFDTTHLKTRFGAAITRFDQAPVKSSVERTYTLAHEVLAEAIAMAQLPPGLAEAPLFFATPSAESEWKTRRVLHDSVARHQTTSLSAYGRYRGELTELLLREDNTAITGAKLADDFQIGGSVTTLTTACASGGSAIQLAVDAIRRGDTDIAVVVGADAGITQENITRFSLLSALSTQNETPESASTPFDKKRDGFVMGEGAAALILESEASARQRGADIFGFVLGCGNATDNFHKTRSHPSGDWIVASMQRAMDDAGIGAADIGYINAHGTSTPENDKMESLGITRLLGEHAAQPLVTSTKSMIGHTLCAAGAIEAVISLQAVKTGIAPPNINLSELDGDIALSIPTQATTITGRRIAMSNSFGFGGQNVTLIVGGEDLS